MSDLKLTQLAALTAPSYDDLLYIVDSPGGTPASKTVTTANLMQTLGVYTPGQFGAAGDGTTDDSAAFTALKAAVEANGGGVIDGRGKTYVVTTTGQRDFQQYTDHEYAVWIDSDNVHIQNMTLKIATPPTTEYGRFVGLAIGNGATKRYNCTARNIKIDATALSAAELAALGVGGMSCSLGFFNVANFVIENVYIPAGWGFNSCLLVCLFSEYGIVRRCRIDDSIKAGVWMDGAQHFWVTQNYVASTGGHGIQTAQNGDNDREATNYWITDNEIIMDVGGVVGIVMGGGSQNCTIANNRIVHASGSSTIGIICQSSSSVTKKYIGKNNRIIGNTFHGVAGTNFAIVLRGKDVGTYDGSPDECSYNVISENANYGMTYETYLENSAQYNKIINNYGMGADWVVTTKDGVTTATNNTTTPNY